jgi:ankyrin repeat protein
MSQQAASINKIDIEGETELMKASKYGETDKVLTKGADVHLVNSTGETALILASQAGNNEIVKKLLATGSNIHHRSHAGTAIIMAAQEGHAEVLETLIKAGANINDVNTDSNDTPLHLVLKLIRDRDHLKKLVKILVKAKANIHAVNDEGETPVTMTEKLVNPEIKKEIMDLLFQRKKGGRQPRQKSATTQ